MIWTKGRLFITAAVSRSRAADRRARWRVIKQAATAMTTQAITTTTTAYTSTRALVSRDLSQQNRRRTRGPVQPSRAPLCTGALICKQAPVEQQREARRAQVCCLLSVPGQVRPGRAFVFEFTSRGLIFAAARCRSRRGALERAEPRNHFSGSCEFDRPPEISPPPMTMKTTTRQQ